jgi:hypothetical protein
MNEAFFAELSAWLTQSGLAGTPETAVVSGFCDRCVAAGLPLARGLLFIDTLHPVHEGRLFRWGYSPAETPLLEYGRTRAFPENNMARPHCFGSNPDPSAERLKRFIRCGFPFVSAETRDGSDAPCEAADGNFKDRATDGVSRHSIAASRRSIALLSVPTVSQTASNVLLREKHHKRWPATRHFEFG